jgi:thioredoxin reductase
VAHASIAKSGILCCAQGVVSELAERQHMRITIIGPGIGGLSAALTLRRASLDVRVFEQAAELREVGAGARYHNWVALTPGEWRVESWTAKGEVAEFEQT